MVGLYHQTTQEQTMRASSKLFYTYTMTQCFQDTIQQKLLLYTMHAEPHNNFCPKATVLTIKISVDGAQQWQQRYFDQDQDSAYRPAPLPRVLTNTE